MTSWVSRLLPRNGRSLATASENQRAEDRHRHQEAYGYFLPIQTRWQDNDQYGHVNNVVYYSYFDTIINQYLIRLVRALQPPSSRHLSGVLWWGQAQGILGGDAHFPLVFLLVWLLC